MLEGPSVHLARPEGAQRSLTEGAAPTDALTVDDVIVRMSADYDGVTAFLRAVATVWTDTVSRLGELLSALTELEAEAAKHGAPRPNDLARARRAAADAEVQARNDPLSMPADALTPIVAGLERARASIRDAVAAREALVSDLVALVARIAGFGSALERARAERREMTAKIAVPPGAWAALDRADAELGELDRQVREVEVLARSNPSEARSRLGRLTERAGAVGDDVMRLASHAGADIAARDELRGRLDAYRAKALALGQAEDLDLDGLYDAAREALYSAPCDLRVAGDLVTAFQRAVRPRPTEVPR